MTAQTEGNHADATANSGKLNQSTAATYLPHDWMQLTTKHLNRAMKREDKSLNQEWI